MSRQSSVPHFGHFEIRAGFVSPVRVFLVVAFGLGSRNSCPHHLHSVVLGIFVMLTLHVVMGVLLSRGRCVVRCCRSLFADDAVVVEVFHVGVCRVTSPDRRDVMVSRFGACDSAILIVIPLLERIHVV